jgi:phosphoserine aminotransferase
MFDRRVFNFAPGPATLPEEVLKQAAAEMLNWNGLGMGVMEVSHRGKPFMACYEEAIADLRELMNVPDSYAVLFLQGGAIGENAAIPMNLMPLAKNGPKADFIVTGIWTEKSAKEAAKYGQAHIAASSASNGFTNIPDQKDWQLSDDAAYVHICSNETVGGVEFQQVPKVTKPLVADVSSNILSRVWDINDFGVLFGGAQKNIGPAGLSIVIVRKDLLGHAMPITPMVWDWAKQAENDSMLNTPPTYGIYLAGLVFKWLKRQGGVAAMEQQNIAKSNLLYSCIDQSSLFTSKIDPSCRSRMNVTFYLNDESLNDSFVEGAAKLGLMNIKGHKSVGGMRASIYNAMPMAGVQALVEYMKEFERGC